MSGVLFCFFNAGFFSHNSSEIRLVKTSSSKSCVLNFEIERRLRMLASATFFWLYIYIVTAANTKLPQQILALLE